MVQISALSFNLLGCRYLGEENDLEKRKKNERISPYIKLKVKEDRNVFPHDTWANWAMKYLQVTQQNGNSGAACSAKWQFRKAASHGLLIPVMKRSRTEKQPREAPGANLGFVCLSASCISAGACGLLCAVCGRRAIPAVPPQMLGPLRAFS